MRTFLSRYYGVILCVVIVAVGMYLRFWSIGNLAEYGFDQVRDAWKVRDILNGQIILDGPRTGVGDFRIGPLWYYYLTPFFWYTGRDPIASTYANVLVNLFNFIALYWVSSRIFGRPTAIVSVFILAFSRYLMGVTSTPWNVSPIIGVSVVIFYGLHRVVIDGSRRWIPALAALAGLFFHLHAAFVFVVAIIAASLCMAPKRKEVFKIGLLSLPLFLIWFVPTLLFNLGQVNDVGRFGEFMSANIISGFHPRIMARQVIEAFTQWQTIWGWGNAYREARIIIPVIFGIVTYLDKNEYNRRLNILLGLWFVVPAALYALYTGPTSEYYMLLNAPMVVWILMLLVQRLAQLGGLWGQRTAVAVVSMALMWFALTQCHDIWIKPTYAGYWKQRDWAIDRVVRVQEPVAFSEGDLSSYVYALYHEDKIILAPTRPGPPE